jgi:adenosylcobinamide-GDP ribazoletransferase
VAEVSVRPALIALQLLTWFPVRLKVAPTGREVGRSLLWYPAVGLLLGLVLWSVAALAGRLATPLAAALVLSVWVWSTGALHLDGLADSADAWVGGRADRERTLAIMKDPNSGPVAVAAVICILLVKFGALSALHDVRGMPSWGDLHLMCGYIVPPLLARAAVPLLFVHTPYVRAEGIAADLAQYQSRTGGRWVSALTVLLVAVICRRVGLAATGAAGAVYVVMRRAWMRRLGGMTGDCIGAMIEVIETLTLVTIAARIGF